jgi:hypothetical protein
MAYRQDEENAYGDPRFQRQQQQQAQQQQQQPAEGRWTYHLGAKPGFVNGDNEGYFKSIYDDQSIDPNAELQKRAKAYRAQYGAAAGSDDATTFRLMASGQAPPQQRAQAQPTPPPSGVAQQWIAQPAVNPELKQRGDDLYRRLSERAGQALDIDRNDPIIRRQADAYTANEIRASRDYLADLAEREGPSANLRGEERMAAERMGQRTGSFEAELMARELTARRAEIAEALNGMAGLLGHDQEIELRSQLAALDSELRKYGIDVSDRQFNADLGLRAEDRASYWDAVRRDLI